MRALLVVATLLSVAAPARAESSASSSASASASASTVSGAELDRMLGKLSLPKVEDRRAALKQIGELGVEATPAITAKLAELRRSGLVTGGVYIKLTKTPADPDLADALVAAPDVPGSRQALVAAALIRALAHIGSTPACKQLLMLAGDGGGAFKPAVTKELKALGEKSLAALVEARKDPSPDIRNLAGSLLEGMGKRLPSDVVQTQSNQVRADVLRAYAAVKDLDAVPVILSFVNSDRAQVRDAAREAILAYGQDAIWKLREAYANLTGHGGPESWSAAELAQELFKAYDKVRLQEDYVVLEDGLARYKEGKLEDAVKLYDKVLARQPMLDRRGEMVSGYYDYALSIETSDRASALAYLRKAQRLDENGPRAAQVSSEIRYLEGEDLASRGIFDVEPFKEALALDPANPRARAELTRLEGEAEVKKSRAYRVGAAIAVFVLSIAGIIVFGGRRPKRTRPA